MENCSEVFATKEHKDIQAGGEADGDRGFFFFFFFLVDAFAVHLHVDGNTSLAKKIFPNL